MGVVRLLSLTGLTLRSKRRATWSWMTFLGLEQQLDRDAAAGLDDLHVVVCDGQELPGLRGRWWLPDHITLLHGDVGTGPEDPERRPQSTMSSSVGLPRPGNRTI